MALPVRFKKHAKIGASDAESDAAFLEHCFITTGDLETLSDCNSPCRIVVGRTGSGKSALLDRLVRDQEHAIAVNPEHLALNYIANSTVIQFLEAAGVNLDVFYQLLWRHVFVVELLRKRYPKNSATTWLDNLKEKISKNLNKQRALQYLDEYSDSFWNDTEYRIKEIVTKFEEKASLDLKAKGAAFELGAAGARNLSEDVKAEVLTKGQTVVNELQIQRLADVIQMLQDDVFDDDQKNYYLVIDRLDENWVDEKIRYKLIRALLETTRFFQRVKRVKVVLALRTDLLQRVLSRTRDSGFQEEKFEGLYLRLAWTRGQLRELLESRLNRLLESSYTKSRVTFEDIFPNQISKDNAFQYVISRTLMRPRDAILFVNECLSLSEGKASVTAAVVKQAEANYSRGRLASLADEWHADFPHLLTYVKLIEGKPTHFKLSLLDRTQANAFVLDSCCELPESDQAYKLGQDLVDEKRPPDVLISYILKVLYLVGVIGIKPDSFNETQWVSVEKSPMLDGHLKPNASIQIHPCYWRALGADPSKHATAAS
jgi:archaellum biogenesis ATPase FlaH